MRVPSGTRDNIRPRRLSTEVVCRQQRLAGRIGPVRLPGCRRAWYGATRLPVDPEVFPPRAIGLPKHYGLFSGQRGIKGEYNRVMQGKAKLTPIQVLERLQLRLEQRMESLQRVKLDGYHVVISELETELDLLRRAQRYLED
jgi:hypothetical protein